MPLEQVATKLKIARNREIERKCVLSSGVEIQADLREIEHPEGRFVRNDGTRYDVCVMDVRFDLCIQSPALADTFVGDRKDTEPSIVRIGFRDCVRNRFSRRLSIS